MPALSSFSRAAYSRFTVALAANSPDVGSVLVSNTGIGEVLHASYEIFLAPVL